MMARWGFAPRRPAESLEGKWASRQFKPCVMNYDEAHQVYLIVRKNCRSQRRWFVDDERSPPRRCLQGSRIGEIAYQNAVSYAVSGLQGRLLSGPRRRTKKARSIIGTLTCAGTLLTMPLAFQRSRPGLHAVDA